MNPTTVTAILIKLFGAYELFLVCDDLFYVLAKQATDPTFNLYHFYAFRMGFRIIIGAAIIYLAVPLANRLVKDICGLSK